MLSARDFLTLIYGGLDGYAVIGTKNAYGDLDTERSFGLPRDLLEGRIARYVDLRADQDVYCSVASFSQPRRSKDDSEAQTNVVWADADLAHPEVFRLKPSIVVSTSKDRYHLFWILNDPVDARTAQEMARRVANAHRDEGCDMGWTMTKYLRVPGTVNLKYDHPWNVGGRDTGGRYDISDFETAYPTEEFDNESVDDLDRQLPSKPEPDEVINLENRIPVELRHLYTDIPTEGVSWSERAMRLWCDLFREGFEDYEVYAIALNAACNKYAPRAWGRKTQTGETIPQRNNWEDVTWREVLKAKVRVEEEQAQPVPVVVDNRMTFTKERPRFVTDAERSFIAESPINFIQKYRTMGERFTGSAPIYHDQFATMILSGAFGDIGHINLPYMANRPLNLWGLILGESTSSRKSTALQLGLDVLQSMDQELSTTTYIGSDITAEGLTKALQGRDGLVSLVSVDEVSGLFSSMSAKKYQMGLQERFTELYDGRVPKILRSSQDASMDDISTCFNFYGAGVRTRVTDILSVEDYQSGFLMRFTWAVDERKGYDAGSSAVKFQRNHPEMDYQSTAIGRQASVEELGTELALRRSHYLSEEFESGPYYDFDFEAEDRFNTWLESAHKYVAKSGLDFVHSAVERLGTSVMKLACLLHLWSMPERESLTLVPITPLLITLKQAENWLYDMLLVASEVTSSVFEERLNDVERYLIEQSEHTTTEVQLRRKFAGLKPKEFDEALSSLEKQGRVRFLVKERKYQALI